MNEDNYRIIPSVTDWVNEINNWPEADSSKEISAILSPG